MDDCRENTELFRGGVVVFFFSDAIAGFSVCRCTTSPVTMCEEISLCQEVEICLFPL